MIRLFRERLGLAIGDGYGQTETGAISRHARPARTTPPATARWAGRCPGSRPGSSTASCSCAPPPRPPSSTATSTASRFEGEWWPTGDLVREDEDGYLWFEGRNDDLILSSGYRIGPFEVESALVSHPAVAEAAAVAAPDPERGSVVRAIVVLRDGSEPSERARRASCRSTSRRRPRPTSTRASSSSPTELPKTTSGKIRRAELRARLVCRGDDGDRPQADRRADRGPAGAATATAPARSAETYERAVKSMPNGVPSSFQENDPWPVYIDRGEGSRVWDVDGNEYVDFHNGFGVMCIGHANPTVGAAVKAQVDRGTHFAAPTDGSIAVAEELQPPLRPAAVALQQLRHRVDDGRRPPRPRRHRPRHDPQDRGLLPRPPRRGDGLRLPAAGGARRPRRPGQRPLRRRLPAGAHRADPRGPLQRRRGARERARQDRRARSPG